MMYQMYDDIAQATGSPLEAYHKKSSPNRFKMLHPLTYQRDLTWFNLNPPFISLQIALNYNKS